MGVAATIWSTGDHCLTKVGPSGPSTQQSDETVIKDLTLATWS
jgi:hypothetical protein